MIREGEFETAEVGQIWVAHLGNMRYEVIDVQRVPIVDFAVVTVRDERGHELTCMWWDHVCAVPSRKKILDLSLPNTRIIKVGEDG
ncbi:MAG: hypothetical protein ABIB97_05375 [Patescibacteria group bacterium]